MYGIKWIRPVIFHTPNKLSDKLTVINISPNKLDKTTVTYVLVNELDKLKAAHV